MYLSKVEYIFDLSKYMSHTNFPQIDHNSEWFLLKKNFSHALRSSCICTVGSSQILRFKAPSHKMFKLSLQKKDLVSGQMSMGLHPFLLHKPRGTFTDYERCRYLCYWPRPQVCRGSCSGSKRCRARRAEGKGRRREGECRSQQKSRRPERGATAQRRANDQASLCTFRCRNDGGGNHRRGIPCRTSRTRACTSYTSSARSRRPSR